MSSGNSRLPRRPARVDGQRRAGDQGDSELKRISRTHDALLMPYSHEAVAFPSYHHTDICSVWRSSSFPFQDAPGNEQAEQHHTVSEKGQHHESR